MHEQGEVGAGRFGGDESGWEAAGGESPSFFGIGPAPVVLSYAAGRERHLPRASAYGNGICGGGARAGPGFTAGGDRGARAHSAGALRDAGHGGAERGGGVLRSAL